MSYTSTPKRKSAPKARTGCSTCKARHVRCDEKKPRCGPCEKSEYLGEPHFNRLPAVQTYAGRTHLSQRVPVRKRVSKLTGFKGSRQCEYATATERPTKKPLKVILWQPQSSLTVRRVSPSAGRTSDEGHAFDFFRVQMAQNLGGVFDSSFWSQDVLRVAVEEQSVRHALVAVAALSESRLKTASESAGSSSTFPKTFIIQQHNKAVSELSRRMQEGTESPPEVVLMTCVLLIYFDMLQDNYESALRQMSSGMYVFFEWHSRHITHSQRASNRSRRQPSELMAPLRRIFQIIMLQIVCFIDTKPRDWHFMIPKFTPPMPSIPTTFASIDDAKDYQNNCLCALFHKELTSHIRSLGNQRVSESPVPASQIGDETLQRWALSFQSFQAQGSGKLPPKERQAAIVVQMRHTIGSMFASAGVYSSQTFYDSYEGSFSEILALASRFIQDMSETVRETEPSWAAFDTGVLGPLYFVASRCRHPLIRRRALDLLRKGPCQEGIWNRDLLSSVAERIIQLEEANYSGIRRSTDVPATARVHVLNATINSTERAVTIHWCRQRFGNTGEPYVLHERVEY